MRPNSVTSSLRQQNKGFTLIELILVINIIALIFNMGYASVVGAKRKSRDTKRIANIKSIQAGLEMYFNDNRAYPYAAAARSLGTENYDVLCSTGTLGVGFRGDTTGCTQTYIAKIPAPPPSNINDNYTYTSLTAGGGASYTLTFTLEGNTGTFTAGTKTATPLGISN